MRQSAWSTSTASLTQAATPAPAAGRDHHPRPVRAGNVHGRISRTAVGHDHFRNLPGGQGRGQGAKACAQAHGLVPGRHHHGQARRRAERLGPNEQERTHGSGQGEAEPGQPDGGERRALAAKPSRAQPAGRGRQPLGGEEPPQRPRRAQRPKRDQRQEIPGIDRGQAGQGDAAGHGRAAPDVLDGEPQERQRGRADAHGGNRRGRAEKRPKQGHERPAMGVVAGEGGQGGEKPRARAGEKDKCAKRQSGPEGFFRIAAAQEKRRERKCGVFDHARRAEQGESETVTPGAEGPKRQGNERDQERIEVAFPRAHDQGQRVGHGKKQQRRRRGAPGKDHGKGRAAEQVGQGRRRPKSQGRGRNRRHEAAIELGQGRIRGRKLLVVDPRQGLPRRFGQKRRRARIARGEQVGVAAAPLQRPLDDIAVDVGIGRPRAQKQQA